jgi:hypothetical protein
MDADLARYPSKDAERQSGAYLQVAFEYLGDRANAIA